MDSKIKGGGGLAEFPLWGLDLWGGDLLGPRKLDSNWISRDSGAAKWVRIVLGIFTLSAVLLGATSAFDLRVNWTESMPRGIHQRVRPAVERGAWVAVCLESDAAELARERGYVIDGSCPSGLTPVFKRVVGIPGDRIRIARDWRRGERSGRSGQRTEGSRLAGAGARAHGGGRDRPHGGPLLRDGNEPVAELG